MKAWRVRAYWNINHLEEGTHITYVYAEDRRAAEQACMEEMARATQNLAEDFEEHVYSIKELGSHIEGLKRDLAAAEKFLAAMPQ
jgi:hypothetical protein